MEFRKVGNSGLMTSEVVYGNWLTHGSQLADEDAVACVRAALDAGITGFDTADEYADTRAESVLGGALRGQRREGLEIFTKVYWPTGGGRDGRNERGLSRKHILNSIDGSLRRLRTDYVDLYQAHRFDYSTPLEETLQTFADLVRSGRILYLGVSEWNAREIRAAKPIADGLGLRLIANQPQYSMLWRVIEPEVVPACVELGIGQIVWSPLAQGVLTGKYQPGQPLPAGSRATDQRGGAENIAALLDDDLLARVQRLGPIAADAGLSPAQLAVAWVLQNPNVSAAIVGASRPAQVIENAKAAGVRLAEELMRRIDEVLGPAVQRDPALTTSPADRP